MSDNILLYDDDADILEICKYVLERKGYHVDTRLTCASVVEDMRQLAPQMVIMDNWIPDIGGVEAIRLIKRHEDLKKIPIVLFTANKNIKSLAEEAGADAYLGKPFDLKDLEQTVEKIISKQKA